MSGEAYTQATFRYIRTFVRHDAGNARSLAVKFDVYSLPTVPFVHKHSQGHFQHYACKYYIGMKSCVCLHFSLPISIKSVDMTSLMIDGQFSPVATEVVMLLATHPCVRLRPNIIIEFGNSTFQVYRPPIVRLRPRRAWPIPAQRTALRPHSKSTSLL
jgi:hypothetical protein